MRYITAHITAIDSPYLNKNNTGLGNVLYQISSIYGIAKLYNLFISLPRLDIYLKKIKTLYGYNHGDTIFRNFKSILEDNNLNNLNYETIYENFNYCGTYCEEIIKHINSTTNNIYINGYLGSYKYFNNISSEIKELFSCDINTYNYIFNKYNDIFNSNMYDIISVHFRLDYQCAFFTKNIDFYKKAIDYFCLKFKNPIFLIFSDIDFVDYNIFKDVKYIKIKEDLDYIELYMMSFCHHNIISVSTFAWWGAFLNNNPNKIVLYDKRLQFESLELFTGI